MRGADGAHREVGGADQVVAPGDMLSLTLSRTLMAMLLPPPLLSLRRSPCCCHAQVTTQLPRSCHAPVTTPATATQSPCGCRVFARRRGTGGCHAVAMLQWPRNCRAIVALPPRRRQAIPIPLRLPCGCRVFAMRLPCLAALWPLLLPCSCLLAMRTPRSRLPCSCLGNHHHAHRQSLFLTRQHACSRKKSALHRQASRHWRSRRG